MAEATEIQANVTEAAPATAGTGKNLVPYASQRVAYWYFVIALALFVLQLLVGLWLAISYAFTIPQSIVDVLPFGMTRAMHTNLLVLWMLLGFMGGTYYLVPPMNPSKSQRTRRFVCMALVIPNGRTST